MTIDGVLVRVYREPTTIEIAASTIVIVSSTISNETPTIASGLTTVVDITMSIHIEASTV